MDSSPIPNRHGWVFRVDGASADWSVMKECEGAPPSTLETRTSDHFFNGIECARLDPASGRLYVSAGFGEAPRHELRISGFAAAAFEGWAKYYDGRRAAFTLSNDNWGCNAWAHPVIHQGRLYLRHHDLLLCYDLRK